MTHVLCKIHLKHFHIRYSFLSPLKKTWYNMSKFKPFIPDIKENIVLALHSSLSSVQKVSYLHKLDGEVKLVVVIRYC